MASSGFDITSLTEDQQLALQQYTSVTDQDLGDAVPILQKCQWNAQIAITRFFDGDAETIDPAAEAARAAPPTPPAQTVRRTETLMDSINPRSPGSRSRRQGGLEEAPRVVPTPESQLSQPLPFPFSVLLLPFNLTYVIFQRVFGTIGFLFPFLPRLLSRFWSGSGSRPSRDTGRRPLSPSDTAARFMREFEEEYGVTHGTVPFHEAGYAQAFDIAKRDLKYLLVILLSPEHDDNASFVRDTLLAPELLTFLKEPKNNIVLWAGTVQDAEAYQVSTALNVTKFPYACLIAHTPSVSSTAMSKIATSAGSVTVQELIQKLQAGIQTQSAELDRIRRQRQEQQASRSLRQEQESAYERSLAADREKARKRKEDEAAKEKADREEREREERETNAAELLAQWKSWRRQNIAPEPGNEVKDAVRISLRLQNGERVIRKFRPEAEVEELYAFVECREDEDDENEATTPDEKEAQKPQGYEHEYGFRLVSPMPREVYDVSKGGTIRERIGRSGNLIVEKIVDEDEDDGDEEE
ncbi:UBX domain-containing protein 10 [Recurvomyces mirabilis]|nr:UBX domain-containing protein 10 [Recurvomyces mirabilis]